MVIKNHFRLLLLSFLSLNLWGKKDPIATITSAPTPKIEKNGVVKHRRFGKQNSSSTISQAESAVKIAQASETPARKRRGKKRQSDSNAPSVVKKTLSTMNLQELKQSKDALIAQGNKEVAIKYLEKMIPLCTDMHDLSGVMIELGDLYYDTGSLIKAFTMYREFVNLYPGSDRVEYALYRAVVCKFDEISDAERDQSQTKETIDLAEEFLERAELFVTHKEKVEEILTKCRERLFENELNIFNFYLFNNRFVAAHKRLDSMKKEFNSLLSDIEPRFMVLEIDLAQAQNNNELVEKKQHELITKFPDYIIKTAQNIPQKKSLIERF